jgi:hypothetical protein
MGVVQLEIRTCYTSIHTPIRGASEAIAGFTRLPPMPPMGHVSLIFSSGGWVIPRKRLKGSGGL